MKIKDLKGIAYSSHGCMQFAVLYNYNSQVDIENGCTVDYLIQEYGELELHRIQAVDDMLVLEVRV